MTNPKIYVTANGRQGVRYMIPSNIARLGEFAECVIDEREKDYLGEDAMLRELAGVRAILNLNGVGTAGMTERVLQTTGTIEVIVTAHSADWAGLEDVAKKCGIKTAEGSQAVDLAVAEWTVGVSIMGVRRLLEAGHSLKVEGIWRKDWACAGLLFNSTVGLIGLGRIGRIVARHMVALGATVIAYDKYFSGADAKQLGVKLVSLDELISTADVISLHLPVTPETTGLLGRRELKMIKDNAVFVNSARAALYDEAALVEELRTGRFTAFIDTFAEEPLVKDHPFRSFPNVYISSHIGVGCQATYERAAKDAIETLREYFTTGVLHDSRTGKPPFVK